MINYINLMALGNFNPAIVTPDFLNQTCGFNLGNPTSITPPNIPVSKQIIFKNLSFLVLLDRFEIKDVGSKDIYNTKIVKFFRKYYEILPYTPLNAVGTNINCDLVFEKNDPRNDIEAKISNPNIYLKFFDIHNIFVTEKSIYDRGNKTWKSSQYRVDNIGGLTRSINVMIEPMSFSLNYNSEAGDLKTHIGKMELLLNSYTKFCEEFYSFVKFLQE